MKKYSILFLIILSFFGCNRTSNKVTITGEIKGLGTDTIYLYGMDDSYDRIDTIYVKDDKFSFTPKVDTVACAFLMLKHQTEYPIFFNKGEKINIKGDVSNLDFLTIDGNTYNDEFTAFQESLKGLGKPTENVLRQKAEEFIKQHISSFVSIYLLDKYFVKQESPDFSKIKELTANMTGILQDKIYIENLNEFITESEKLGIDKYAPFFSIPNAKGERISRTSEAFKEKCLLINFWASWNNDSISKQSNKELRDIYRTYKNNKYLGMIGISFDIDKDQWKEAIRKDTLNWEQVSDFNGLNSEVAKQYAIQSLPTNVLLSAEGRILGRNLRGETFKKKIEEAVKVAEDKDKENKKKKK